MSRYPSAMLVAISMISLVTGSCGSVGSGGPRKVVVGEEICNEARFLRMVKGQTNRVVLDNTVHSDEQSQITVTLERFPVLVKGPVPEGSRIGDPFSTIVLSAKPGETKSVDLEPAFLGTYKASCSIIGKTASGLKTVREEVTFELVDR